MKATTLMLAVFAAAMFTGTLSAQESTPPSNKTPGINERQVNQQKRVRQGVKSGELTKKETRHLEAREAKIQADKKAAKADGNVTKAERRKLTREQNNASKAIYAKKHNARVRP